MARRRWAWMAVALLAVTSCTKKSSQEQLDAALPIPDRMQVLLDNPTPFAYRHHPATDLDAERFEIEDPQLGEVEVTRSIATLPDGTRHKMTDLSFPNQQCAFVDADDDASLRAFAGGAVSAISTPTWSAAQGTVRVLNGPLAQAYIFIGMRCPSVVVTTL